MIRAALQWCRERGTGREWAADTLGCVALFLLLFVGLWAPLFFT